MTSIKANHILLFLIIFSSCSTYKNIPYFQDLDRSTITIDSLNNSTQLVLQAEDILGINVSSMNPEASAIFNYSLSRVTGNNFDISPNNPVFGYLVDRNGYIQLPLLGDMKVAGLTTSQLREELKNQLLTYLNEPVVNVRLLNFRISVLGDVLRPGVYTIQNEKISIPEALSLAGDLNITGIRTNMLLIRELNGERQFVPLDLTSKEFFDSPHFYLKNNDVLYIQPDRTKFATVDRGYRTASLFLSTLSVVAIIFTGILR